MEPVAIGFSANDDFAMLLGVALCSIFENKKGGYDVCVFVIDGGISGRNKQRLGELEKRYGFQITYVTPPARLFEHIRTAGMQIELPVETYYRLAVGSVIPADYRKAIYMDVDVVVRGDIGELFRIDLAGKTVGAAADCFPDARRAHLAELCADMPSAAVPPAPAYFNAGVLLIDLDRWRSREIEKRAFQFIRQHPGGLLYHDQDALNVMLLGDWKQLPARFNLLAELAGAAGETNPLIVHYSGGGKPWYFFSALPYRSDYLYYVGKTAWKKRKYRKVMDVHFAKKYHMYPVLWGLWVAYKNAKRFFFNRVRPRP